jgi:hypothetical protein
MASHIGQSDNAFIAATFRFRCGARWKASRVKNVARVAGRKAWISHILSGIFASDHVSGHVCFPSFEAWRFVLASVAHWPVSKRQTRLMSKLDAPSRIRDMAASNADGRGTLAKNTERSVLVSST